MSGDRRLHVRGYHGGFSNNRMSLDISVALAHLTGRTLVPFGFELPEVRNRGRAHPTLFDLFDVPVPWMPLQVSVPDARGKGLRRCDWHPVFDSVFAYPDVPSSSDERFRAFRNGRGHVNTFSEEDDDADELVVDTRTLGHYSYFFYLDAVRQRSLVELMRKVRPKRPYRDLAERVVEAIGPFNAVHVRRRDFVDLGFTPRASTVPGTEVAAVLAASFDDDRPLIICTDQPDDAEFFRPIREQFSEAHFVNRLLGCDLFRPDLKNLPFADETVIGLLTQLVAARADGFVGTLFSTFTGIIHRLRGFAGRNDEFRYCYNDFDSPLVHFADGVFADIADGPFSWNRLHLPVLPAQLSWVREWPEAYTVAEDADPEPSPSTFSADRAVVHGAAARVEGAPDPCIGWWTDPQDSVEWHLDPRLEGEHTVEIRYACPVELAGSAYEIGVGDRRLAGTVRGTGGWGIPSPWLRVGRVELTREDDRIGVRVVKLAAGAALNLYGLRLVREAPYPAGSEPVRWATAMNGQDARREMVRRVGRELTFAAAVETGTFYGDTTGFLADVLRCDVWSAELDAGRAAAAAQRFGARSDVHVVHRDSRALIAELAPTLGGVRTFFYLDAHWISDFPLWGEVELVLRHWSDPVILVDDFAVPGDTGYGYDAYGREDVFDSEHLAPLIPPGYSWWFPTTPSVRETGKRQGCVVIARDEHTRLLRRCGLRRAARARDIARATDASWIDRYRRLNESFERVCVYRVGSQFGFLSEYNNLILAVLYCLQRGIQLRLSSIGANFAVRRGLRDYLLPFCDEDDDPIHVRVNDRYEPAPEDLRETAERVKRERNIDLLKQDIWSRFRSDEFRHRRFDIPLLGIEGDLLQAASTVARALWRFQPDVRDRVRALIEDLHLPAQYVGMHVRRGDKATEVNVVGLKEYFRAAEARTAVRAAFLATDDHAVVQEARANFREWTIFTLCGVDASGHDQAEFNARDPAHRFEEVVRLLADVEALYAAQHLFVTYTSNIGIFLGMRRGHEERPAIESLDLPYWKVL